MSVCLKDTIVGSYTDSLTNVGYFKGIIALGDYLYCIRRAATPVLLRIKKSDMSLDSTLVLTGYTNTAVTLSLDPVNNKLHINPNLGIVSISKTIVKRMR